MFSLWIIGIIVPLVLRTVWSTHENEDISIDQILADNNGYKEYVDDREFTLMELDMIVDKSDKTTSRPERYRAIFDKDETKRWQIDVPFEISDGIGDIQELTIRRAIPIWEQYSCLNFYYNKHVYNRLVFKLGEDNLCGSEVGMKQGPQVIYLGKNCFQPEIIVHEIGHALGFYHEHNRWDRDTYIKIHYENIRSGYNGSFIERKPENADFDHDYDYLSIMHYGQYFFSKNTSAKRITIETTDPNFQSKIGKVKHPSFQDYKTLNAMYKCEDVCAKVKCPEGGFLGKHCQCYCKGNPDGIPVRLCFKKDECPKPLVNKYLFDVMNKDNTSTINMTRTSFPDKTVLNLFSTNWNCSLASQLRCEGGKWSKTDAECPVELDIEMIGETEGLVEVTLNEVYRGYICDDDWDDNDATVACKMLGYPKGWAYFQNPQEVNESLPILLDNVQCRGDELSLADCKHNGWGNHDCEYYEVVSVKCFDDSYPNHIDKTHCGKIKLNDSKRKKRQLKVTGGFETIMGMHPWQVEIQRRKRGWIHWCGGTIINNEWILSAAHCFDDLKGKYDGSNAKLDLKDVRVIVGDHDLTIHDEYEKMFHIEYIVKHWNYSEFERNYSNNDIALLKIKSTSGISFNNFIQPACLPEEVPLLSSDTKCEVSGWGKEREHGTLSDKLRAAEVTIIKEHVCQGFYNNYPIEFQKVICAGDGSADTCQGDSGGPLICEINGQSTVIGITSWGKGCGKEEAPGVYTKVSEYIRWINSQISNHRLEEVRMVCTPPQPCRDSSLRYHYNIETNRCEQIKYGGCEGNSNFFETKMSCYQQCRAELPKTINTTTVTRPKPIPCPTLSQLQHGSLFQNTGDDDLAINYGSVVQYSCDENYYLNGNAQLRILKRTCQSDGTWSGNEPKCEAILCPALSNIQHGSLFQIDLSNNYGNIVEYTCDKDFYLNGNAQLPKVYRTCLSDGTWSGGKPTCEAIICPTLSQLQHGSLLQDTDDDLANNYGSVVQYSCDMNYYLNGNAQLRILKRTCQSDGTWSGNEPKCEAILCPALSNIQHGSLFQIHLANNYGSIVEYTCDKDFYLNGKTELQKVYRRCLSDGAWSGEKPTCKAILCPTLSQLQHGSLFQSKKDGIADNYGSIVKYTCDKGFFLNGNAQIQIVERTCQSDGKWSGHEPTCEAIICPALSRIQNGSVLKDTSYGFANNYEKTNDYSCYKGMCVKQVEREIVRLAKSGKRPLFELLHYACNFNKANYAVRVRINEVTYNDKIRMNTARGTVIASLNQGKKSLTQGDEMLFHSTFSCQFQELEKGKTYIIIGKDGNSFRDDEGHDMFVYSLMGTTLVMEYMSPQQYRVDRRNYRILYKVQYNFERLILASGCQHK